MSNYNCVNIANTFGGRGVTLWGPDSVYLSPGNPGGSFTWAFTGTHPKCYQTQDSCNVTYTIHTTANAPDDEVGPINMELNAYTNPSRPVNLGDRYHSKIAGHDLTETIELANVGPEYHDAELNTITFTNRDPNVGVWINNFRIIRVYQICGMNKEDEGCCKRPQDGGCSDNDCGVEENTGIAGNLDWSRKDYACNHESPGNRLSYTGFANNSVKSVGPYQTASWTWTNPADVTPSNYVGSSVCLFNLNNIQLTTSSNADDVPFTLSVNGSAPAYYWRTKIQSVDGGIHSAAASVDLVAQFPGNYNDSPGASNTVTLTNNSNVTLLLCDGTYSGLCTDCINNPNCSPTMGYVNIYRIYQTANNCQDNFDDNFTDESWWTKLQVNGATASETGNALQVTVPSGGSGWAQAGYVTRYSYNMLGEIGANQQGLEVKIDVTQLNNLDQMTLLISSDPQVINSDPYNQNNWYRIAKIRRYYTNNVLMVNNKINGTWAMKLTTPWISSTGQLKISVSTGSIAFYENGILKYAEPFALPSSRCYIYAYARSERPVSAGTDKFDNYTLYPTQIFKDDFTDGNYNGWTVDSGSWQVTTLGDKKLQSTAQSSHIHVNTAFSANRHVKADIQTLAPGGNSWDVSWLYVKEQDGNNNVYALIHTDGTVELAMFYQGQKTMWTAPSSLNPRDIHALAVSIIGTNAKVWVDGTLYHNITNSNLPNIAGYVGLYTLGSTGSFDNVIVFTQ